NRLDDRRREEHPGLGRVDADVGEDCLELGADELGRHLEHVRHADRVLRGQRDDRRRPVAPRGRERLQVGLDPGPTARVGAGDRQTARNAHAWHRRGMGTPFTHTTWQVKAGREAEFVERWLEWIQWSHRQGLRARARLLRDVENPSTFVSFGPWETVSAVRTW